MRQMEVEGIVVQVISLRLNELLETLLFSSTGNRVHRKNLVNTNIIVRLGYTFELTVRARINCPET